MPRMSVYENQKRLNKNRVTQLCNFKIKKEIHAQEIVWQSGMQSCMITRLPGHLLQELNVGTVTKDTATFSLAHF